MVRAGETGVPPWEGRAGGLGTMRGGGQWGQETLGRGRDAEEWIGDFPLKQQDKEKGDLCPNRFGSVE